jgi:LacI family transcriptional regulator
MLGARKVDGVLVVGDNNKVTASVTQYLEVPVVYVYGESDVDADIVHMPDDENGIGLVADHLVATGRRRIAHLTGPRRTTAVVQRVHGLNTRLKSHRLRLSSPVQYGEWSQRWGRAATLALLEQQPDLDALVCGSDQIASGALAALSDLGRKVPEDVAVTGYDNWGVFALESEPQLTTVDMNLEALGAAAARELFTIIDGETRPGGVRRHACELVVRDST